MKGCFSIIIQSFDIVLKVFVFLVSFGEIPKEPTQKLAVANTLGRIFAGKNYLKPMPCLELVSKKLNHFGVIADLFRQIGGHSSRFVLF